MSRTILITGCSSGIGAALAREFKRQGHRVYATARRVESLQGLASEGMHILALDVNDDESIATALAQVQQEAGQLDVLVNNAGFSQVGAVLDLEREDLRAQYETNVIAPVAMTRAALPLLRAAVASSNTAVLVNIGSIVGTFTTPFAAAYCSSKAAIHSLSDGLRMELAPFGIEVVTVQPGGVLSAFGDHAQHNLQLPEGSLYLPVADGIRARAQAGQQGATPAEEFVIPVVKAILQQGPPAIIRGGKNSMRVPLLKKILPLRSFDKAVARVFGLDQFKPDRK